MYVIMCNLDMCLREKDATETAFIRNVILSPEKIVFLATDTQLNDIDRFCTSNDKFCIVGVDPTYNVGPCYVTVVVTYRHLHFKTKLNEHPVMVGPMLLHTRKEYSSYFQLPSNMMALKTESKNILVIGSDSEKNVYQPFLDILKSPQHLFCDLHKKCRELHILQCDLSEIMR